MPRKTKAQIQAEAARKERYDYIHRRVSGALRGDPVNDPARYDWGLFNSEIEDAGGALIQAEHDYADNKIDEAGVKEIYKAYVQLHLRNVQP